MPEKASAGYEVSKYKTELTGLIIQIMAEHTERKGCQWSPNAIENILCDLSKSVERQEICKAAEAA